MKEWDINFIAREQTQNPPSLPPRTHTHQSLSEYSFYWLIKIWPLNLYIFSPRYFCGGFWKPTEVGFLVGFWYSQPRKWVLGWGFDTGNDGSGFSGGVLIHATTEVGFWWCFDIYIKTPPETHSRGCVYATTGVGFLLRFLSLLFIYSIILVAYTQPREWVFFWGFWASYLYIQLFFPN